MSEQERQLRCLAMNDETSISSLLGLRLEPPEASSLDAKAQALVRLGALVVVHAAPATYHWAVEIALARGATDEEVIETLVAVAPVAGMARAVSAAPEIAIALGYPVDAALELLNPEEVGERT